MRKREKSPSSAGNYYEIRAKEQKQAHLNWTVKGWFHHFRHLLKKKHLFLPSTPFTDNIVTALI